MQQSYNFPLSITPSNLVTIDHHKDILCRVLYISFSVQIALHNNQTILVVSSMIQLIKTRNYVYILIIY